MIKSTITISFILSLGYSLVCAQNFEGIIFYQRESQSGSFAIEKYYFKYPYLRIDSEFYINGEITEYKTIYDFESYPNYKFKYQQKLAKYFQEEVKPRSIVQIDTSIQNTTGILARECKFMQIFHEPIFAFDQETEVNQQYWYDKNLKFEIPNIWTNSPYMVNMDKACINLKLIEKGESSSNFGGYSYQREAFKIINCKLSSDLFTIE